MGKKRVSIFAVWIFFVMFLSACGAEKELTTVIGSETTEAAEAIQNMNTRVQEEPELETIPIDYPFPSAVEGYTLALVASREQAGWYDLQVCSGSGAIVQQFSCGALVKPVTFCYDDLFHDTYPDLEIFSADSQSGILFSFNRERSVELTESKVFVEEAVEIPRYDEVQGSNMLVRTEDEDCVEKVIDQLVMDKMRVDEIRRWRVQKDTGMLTIWDCPEQKMIFEGQTELDETGEPLNAEYYNYLLWNDIYQCYGDSDSSEIRVWISEPGGEDSNQMAEYTNRQSLLEDFGFADQKPTEQCYDFYGNLSLELYVDESEETALGIVHEYSFSSDMEKAEQMYGFSIGNVGEGVWEEPDPFDMKSVYGDDGSNQVEDYEETLEYREDGQPDFFQSSGNITWLKDAKAEGKDTLIRIDYIYRDDGILYYRGYQHNGYVFSTTYTYLNSFYDEVGRILYEEGYITHGRLLSYYFYENDERKPKYCLKLDDNLGYYIPEMISYH